MFECKSVCGCVYGCLYLSMLIVIVWVVEATTSYRKVCVIACLCWCVRVGAVVCMSALVYQGVLECELAHVRRY